MTNPSPARADCARAAPIPVDLFLPWARAVARGIARYYRFGLWTQEARDIEQVAYLTLCRIAPAFDRERVPDGGDPHGQFKGWAHPHVRGECVREAIRLRNGGTYWTRCESVLTDAGERVRRAPVAVEPLPVSRDGDCSLPARAEGESVEVTDGSRAKGEKGKARPARLVIRSQQFGDPAVWRDYLQKRKSG